MGKIFGAILSLLAIPLLILNTLGGVVAGVWLIAVGEWKELLFGVGVGLVGTFLISFALLPGILIAAPGLVLVQRRSLVMLPFLVGSLLWTYFVMIGWSLLIYAHFLGAAHSEHIVPFVLLAYATATGPWGYMATKEQRTDPDAAAPMAALFLQFANVAIMGSIWMGHGEQSLFGMALFAVPVMGLSFLVQVGEALETLFTRRRWQS